MYYVLKKPYIYYVYIHRIISSHLGIYAMGHSVVLKIMDKYLSNILP